jgi:acyl dehydratase
VGVGRTGPGSLRGEFRTDDLRVGDAWETVVVGRLSRSQIAQYAGASGDFHPLHTDEAYAVATAGYPSVFAHGMLTMALSGTLLTRKFGHASVVRYQARFVARVWPGDTLRAAAEVLRISTGEEGRVAHLALIVRNQSGTEVLRGSATVRLG